jgi:hypothetical protein
MILTGATNPIIYGKLSDLERNDSLVSVGILLRMKK